MMCLQGKPANSNSDWMVLAPYECMLCSQRRLLLSDKSSLTAGDASARATAAESGRASLWPQGVLARHRMPAYRDAAAALCWQHLRSRRTGLAAAAAQQSQAAQQGLGLELLQQQAGADPSRGLCTGLAGAAGPGKQQQSLSAAAGSASAVEVQAVLELAPPLAVLRAVLVLPPEMPGSVAGGSGPSQQASGERQVKQTPQSQPCQPVMQRRSLPGLAAVKRWQAQRSGPADDPSQPATQALPCSEQPMGADAGSLQVLGSSAQKSGASLQLPGALLLKPAAGSPVAGSGSAQQPAASEQVPASVQTKPAAGSSSRGRQWRLPLQRRRQAAQPLRLQLVAATGGMPLEAQASIVGTWLRAAVMPGHDAVQVGWLPEACTSNCI